MGFFGKIFGGVKRLGNKVAGGVKYLGTKVADIGKTGYNFVYDNSKQIGDIAGKVGSVAGAISKGATMLAGGLSATGIGVPLAAGLTTLAGVSKGVSLAAGGVRAGTGALELAKMEGLKRA